MGKAVRDVHLNSDYKICHPVRTVSLLTHTPKHMSGHLVLTLREISHPGEVPGIDVNLMDFVTIANWRRSTRPAIVPPFSHTSKSNCEP